MKRSESPEGNIIVIGTSSGGPEALQKLFREVEPGFPAAFLVVQHQSRAKRSYLRDILAHKSPLTVRTVTERMRIEPSTIYLPSSNRHMVARDGEVDAVHGPLINLVRPAVDPLSKPRPPLIIPA